MSSSSSFADFLLVMMMMIMMLVVAHADLVSNESPMLMHVNGTLVETHFTSLGCRGQVKEIKQIPLGSCLQRSSGGYYGKLAFKMSASAGTKLEYRYQDKACTVHTTSLAPKSLLSHTKLPCDKFVSVNYTSTSTSAVHFYGLTYSSYAGTCNASALLEVRTIPHQSCINTKSGDGSFVPISKDELYSSYMTTGCSDDASEAYVSKYASNDCSGTPAKTTLATPKNACLVSTILGCTSTRTLKQTATTKSS